MERGWIVPKSHLGELAPPAPRPLDSCASLPTITMHFMSRTLTTDHTPCLSVVLPHFSTRGNNETK